MVFVTGRVCDLLKYSDDLLEWLRQDALLNSRAIKSIKSALVEQERLPNFRFWYSDSHDGGRALASFEYYHGMRGPLVFCGNTSSEEFYFSVGRFLVNEAKIGSKCLFRAERFASEQVTAYAKLIEPSARCTIDKELLFMVCNSCLPLDLPDTLNLVLACSADYSVLLVMQTEFLKAVGLFTSDADTVAQTQRLLADASAFMLICDSQAIGLAVYYKGKGNTAKITSVYIAQEHRGVSPSTLSEMSPHMH